MNDLANESVRPEYHQVGNKGILLLLLATHWGYLILFLRGTDLLRKPQQLVAAIDILGVGFKV